MLQQGTDMHKLVWLLSSVPARPAWPACLAQPISNSRTSNTPYVEGFNPFLRLTYNILSQHITACAAQYIGCNVHMCLAQCPTQSAVCMHMHMSTFPPSVPLWVTTQPSAAARNAVPQQSIHMHKLVGLLSAAAARPGLARMHDSTDKQHPHRQSLTAGMTSPTVTAGGGKRVRHCEA